VALPDLLIVAPCYFTSNFAPLNIIFQVMAVAHRFTIRWGGRPENGIFNAIPGRIINVMGDFYHASNSYDDDSCIISLGIEIEDCPKS